MKTNNLADLYPLSPMQQGMLFHTLQDGNTGAYIELTTCILAGDLDPAAVREAWEQILSRHDALRTAFVWEGLDEPLQAVLETVNLPWSEHDWRKLSVFEQELELEQFLEAERLRGFDLAQAPLMRLAFMHTGAGEGRLVWTHHHLLFDGWSVAVLIREFFACYDALRSGQTVRLPAPYHYRDFIEWLEQRDRNQASRFWRAQLRGFFEPTPLGAPGAVSKSGTCPRIVEELPFEFDPSETMLLRDFAKSHRLTINTLLQAAWACVLGRYAAVRDVLFGATVSGRPPELPNTDSGVGLFINTLPVRIDACATQPVTDWLADIQAAQVDREAFGYSSLADIHGWSEVPRSVALFESLLVFENHPVRDALRNGSSRLQIRDPWGNERTNYPLNLVAAQTDSQLAFKFIYDADRFHNCEIRQWAKRLRSALIAIPSARCAASISLLTEGERETVVDRWNQTRTTFPRQWCIHELFEVQAAKFPDAAAAVYGKETISYRDLNARANALARQLQSYTLKVGAVVGINLERSIDLLVALLATLKCGAAYLPLDPTYPQDRLAFMIRDSNARCIITTHDRQGCWSEPDGSVRLPLVFLGSEACPEPDSPAANPDSGVAAENLAYVTYTSGSTGEPKGVPVPHRAVVRLICDTNYIRLGSEDRVAQAANASFDAITFEVWGALLNGGCVIGIHHDTVLSPTAMARLFVEERITAVFLTTALFQQIAKEIPDAFHPVRHVLFGGEAVDPRWAREVLRQGPPERLLHVYGPTESTTFATWYLIEQVPTDAKTIPIGQPVSNSSCYVLDEYLSPVGIGMPGELFIGGEGVACGYLKRPGLTAERFLPDPFSGTPGSRLYRTGDVVRRLDDGDIEFLGRRDHQIKIRGFRVELGEIEATLRAIPGVQESAVVRRDDGVGDRLVAYLTPEPGALIELPAVRAFLDTSLPSYMLPTAYVVLSALPLNANGKIDRRALPPPEVEKCADQVAPRYPDEELLVGIWSHVLRTESIGIHDDFFERGGHSLLATQLISRVREAFDLAVPIRFLFENPTPAEFAEALRVAHAEGEDHESAPPLVPTSRRNPPPLSFAQERLWFLHQLEPENPFYNIPLSLRLTGTLNVAALRQALSELVQRHESLRTTFRSIDGRPVQVISTSAVVPLPLLDLSALSVPDQESEVRRMAEADARRPFALAQGPLLRARLLHLRPEMHVLLLSLHHIVSDGWSMGVLTRDLSELYNAAREVRDPVLPNLPVQYADFAAWQRQWLSGDALERQLGYWKAELAGVPPVLSIPTDRPRPAIQSFRGRIETFEIDSELTRHLRKLSSESGTTLFMTLLAGFSLLLARYSDQRDVVIGSPIANRTRSELEQLIGFFVNTLAFRIRIEDDFSFHNLLERVRKIALDAYAHQDLPFERLVDELQTERDLSRNPLFQVMFALQNSQQSKGHLGGLKIEPLQTEAASAQFDLVLDIWETGSTLTGVLEYSTDLFDRETVARMMRHYCNLLAEMVSDPTQTVSSVRFIDGEERRLLLDEFNPFQKKYRTDCVLHELFEEQAARNPERIAVIDHRSQFTYGELNAEANRIAHLLREIGAGRQRFVGILDDRGCDFLAAMLAIIKSGAAFLPLDPGYPEDRLRYMIADSQISTLITRLPVAERVLPGLAGTKLCQLIDLGNSGEPAIVPGSLRRYGRQHLDRCSAENPVPRSTSKDLAYLLYTSGSTGLPKGAMVRHDGAVNHIFAEFDLLSFNHDCAFLQSAPCSADISVWQFLAPGLIGGRSVIADSDTVCDPVRLFSRIRDEGVTLIELVPVVLGALLEHVNSLPAPERALPRLQCAMVTGEAVSVALINTWLALYPDIPIVNAYGPTEAADDVCQYAIVKPLPQDMPSVPIGKPLPNVWLYVLDRQFNLSPVGVPGQICVSGIAVGNGYWNDAERTQRSFIPNRYAGHFRGRTLYQTGDLGRWRPDGNLEYLGRLDEQVKLRGFRIELGEIESVLTRHSAVHEAAVVAQTDDSGEKALTAYIVPQFSRDSGIRVDPLEEEQIALWSDLHDDSYGAAPQVDPTFNCIGWDSNYSGQPLPEPDMREYVATAVGRILSLKPRRLLEIGCGTGLLMFRLVPECERYLGIDLSATVINQLRGLQRSASLCERVPGLSRARFRCCRADRIEELDGGLFDVAILPSVIQYFPSLDYLETVLRNLVVNLSPGGGIFIGDIRNLELLEAFHASVQLFKASPDLPGRELRRRIERGVAQEQELCVHPTFFRTLQRRIPGISSVEILPKAGRHLNEMTRFRYDVIIRLGLMGEPDRAPLWQAWDPALWADFLSAVREGKPSALALTNVPNARVGKSLRSLAVIRESATSRTVAELREAIEESRENGLEPQAICDLAAELGLHAAIALSPDGKPGDLDLVLTSLVASDVIDLRPGLPGALESRSTRPPSELANRPLLEKFARTYVPEFRSFLKTRLPSHMVPANLVVIDRLPLTPAGKVDRRMLAQARPDVAGGRQAGAEPETSGERALATIWSAVLGIPKLSRHDNFFELGGHSLKATQVVSRIQKELGLTISLREVFNNPTIAEFAPLLEGVPGTATSVIPRIPDADHYAVSHAQRRLWILNQMDPEGTAYNVPSAVLLEGALNRTQFERALDFVLRRHESLRTVFSSIDGEPRQFVGSNFRLQFSFADLRDDPAPLQRARQLARDEALRPFDLQRGPLFRLELLRMADEQHVFLATLHHIISDDWSGSVMMRELAMAYSAYLEGREPELEPLRIQYRDYSAWQNALLAQESAKKDRDYWHRQFSGELPVLELPTDWARPPLKTFRGGRVRFELGSALSNSVTEFGRQRGSSLFMTLVASVALLLNRYTQQTDIIMGSPVGGRIHADLEDQIGFYVNTLPLRHNVASELSFDAFLRQVVRTVTNALEHQTYPFDRLVNELNLRRDIRRSPLFDVMVDLRNSEKDSFELPGLKLRPFEYELTTSQFDLTFSFQNGAPGIQGEITFNTDLFEQARIEQMTNHLRTLVEGFIANPGTRLDRLPLVPSIERARLVERPAPVPRHLRSVQDTAVERFERLVELMPKAIAVSFENQHLTYEELNSRANRLANRLRHSGVSRGRRVGLFVGRSIEAVVSILGILKSGAAYVPFDSDYPLERIAFMVSDSDISALVTQASLIGALPALPPQISRVDLLDPTLAVESPENLDAAVSPEDIAYIIYTSGSTGKPKGVPVAHANIVRLFDACQPWFNFNSNDVWTLFHSVAFDFSVWELWGPLLYGGRLVVVPYWISRSPTDFLALLVRENVTVLNQTPSAFRYLVRAEDSTKTVCPAISLRYIIFGGEALELQSLKPWFDRHGDERPRLINMYGITETTVHVTYRPLSVSDLMRNINVIGEPIPDLQVYLLDAHLEPVPIGVPGEIHVGGAGLAQGYLNRADLTAERFVPNPYSFEAGARLYRSGDLARRLANGDLEYLGRIDQQIKIRGFRIELGEIESHLVAYPGVREAAVLQVKHTGESRLAAYVVLGRDAAVSVPELRAFLREQIPEYMVPASFTFLDRLPLTPHGKLDRGSLPAMVEPPENTSNRTLPQNHLERTVASVWAELLGTDHLDAQENIFDLGAHSLLVIQAQERLRELGGWNITVLDLFRFPTIQSLAHHLSGLAHSDEAAVAAAEDRARKQREVRSHRAAIQGRTSQ